MTSFSPSLNLNLHRRPFAVARHNLLMILPERSNSIVLLPLYHHLKKWFKWPRKRLHSSSRMSNNLTKLAKKKSVQQILFPLGRSTGSMKILSIKTSGQYKQLSGDKFVKGKRTFRKIVISEISNTVRDDLN